MNKQKNVPELRFSDFDGNWKNLTLGDISLKITDGTHDTPKPVEKGFVYLTAINIKDGYIDFENCYYLTEEDHRKIYTRCNPEYGDILMVNIGAGTATVARVEVHFEFSLKNVALIKLDQNKISSSFIFQVLSKNSLRLRQELTSGGAQPFFSLKQIGKLKINFPSKKEQEKIANFLSEVNKKLTQLRCKKELLETYKRGLMQKIFSQQIRFKQDDGRAFPDWQEKKIGELFKWIKNNNLSRENLNYNSGIVQNIHYGDIHTKFKSRFSLKKEKVPYINDLDYVSNLDEESFCKQGDLVIVDASEDYTEIGKTIEIIEVESNKLVAGLHCFLARPKDDFIFVLGYPGYLFQSQIIRDQIRKLAQGISVLGISKSNLEKILIPYPHLEEQQKIADFLTVLDKKIEAVAQQIHHTEQFKKGLLQKMFV